MFLKRKAFYPLGDAIASEALLNSMRKLIVIIGLLISSCTEMETANTGLTQKQTQLPVYCMDFVVDETFVFSDSLFESSEYKECKKIVLEKLGDGTEE